MANVLICDDRRNVREALMRAMYSMVGVNRVECVANAHELLDRYAIYQVELVLIGTRRSFPAGVEATRRLVAAYPHVNVIVFGAPDDANGVAAAIAGGARGYVRWEPMHPELASPVTHTLAHALTANILARPPARAPRDLPPHELTPRELQVLRAMSDGKSNAQIGRELFLSEDTVKTHARRLFRKLGAKDRAEAVAQGFRQGIIS
jgi:DNA-binding NarL/FixJ family response regulator